MDGLAEDADVVFLLTTNRADLLEPALASRPGRVDQAVHVDLPDREARRRLSSSTAAASTRPAGSTTCSTAPTVSPRRSSRSCCAARPWWPRTGDGGGGDVALTVSADDLTTALDELLDTRNQMTRDCARARGRRRAGCRRPLPQRCLRVPGRCRDR